MKFLTLRSRIRITAINITQMQKILLLFILLLVCSVGNGQKTILGPSQENIRNCTTTEEQHEHMLQVNPDYRAWQDKISKVDRNRIAKRSPDCSGGKIIIPVAIHYDAGVVQAGQEACMVSNAQLQLAAVQSEFDGTDPQIDDFPELISCFGTSIGESCIEFCLATFNHPTGYGLTEGEPAVTIGQIDFSNISPGTTAVPFDANWAGYLNIYAGNLSGGLLGESAGIGGDFSGTGVVVNACQFGSSGAMPCGSSNNTATCSGSTYDEGNTLAHEIGHYLKLRHIWGDGGCAANDFPVDQALDDTPDMDNNYTGYLGCGAVNVCADLPEGCGSDDMYMNYMSYAGDGCMYMFTSGQSDVMYAYAQAAGFTTALPPQCVMPDPPTAAFSASDGNICLNQCIELSDQSLNFPVTWAWTFTVTSGDLVLNTMTSNNPNPNFCITAGTSGMVKIDLTIGNAAGTDMTTMTIPITIKADTDPSCLALPCTDFAAGPYIDLINYNMCLRGCPVIAPGFEVFANEAYILENLSAGVDYTFEFCSGYSPATWEAVITVVDFSTGSAGTTIAHEGGCTITFTVPSDGNYLIVVSDKNDCGGPENATDNGVLTFTCIAGACGPICDTDFYDNRGPNNNYAVGTTDLYTICPDSPSEIVSVEFSSIDIHTRRRTGDCVDELKVYDGSTTGSTLLATMCGTDLSTQTNNGIFTGSSAGSCLTFEFIASAASPGKAGWEATISCCMPLDNSGPMSGGLFDGQGCQAPVNAGADFSFTFENECNNEGNVGSMGNARNGITTRETCTENDLYTTQTFYAFTVPIGGGNQNMTFSVSSTDPDIAEAQIALYGPSTISCPTVTVGSLIACEGSAGGTNRNPTAMVNGLELTESLPMDGSTYVLVIATEGQGSLELTGNLSGTVPVELSRLSAIAGASYIDLFWETASETNNDGFEILRSEDGQNFVEVGFVTGKGNGIGAKYSFTDGTVRKGVDYYYQLKQYDNDGQFSLSDIVQAKIELEHGYMAFPNPMSDKLNIVVPKEPTRINVYTINGELVSTYLINGTDGIESINLDVNSGIYILEMKNQKGERMLIEKLVKL